ncbi:mannose-6-phosphate isomerase, class I [Bacillus sp. FJAT-49736]|uniref:mannose-6-phosphate isomerase, class I n=1 Tax=Bacillus sp. FJAT-49736 TaxID=2833582 RepID=UPI001BC9A696|nr:mannose-6-phosphate isomerase, class I [Bacillus sp. FJAT-49736]MBS4174467.1 mannose-6-phosphate isomerase, class I [Bacillus sp. FJAT-49736]MBS4175824.1 mannose-6-phosphate isomerase, class I [Bacillus sp. FJAT-49736]
MIQPLFLEGVFQERIWGGTALKEQFGYKIPSDQTGECWAISAHPNGSSIVKNGLFAGKSLIQLWEENRELFGGHPSKVFPLLTKILDAKSHLSVQVHPNDEYAEKYENGDLGKTECWYIIDCKEGSELVYGHNANSKEELVTMLENGEWNQLLRRIPIKPGDFFYVPSGTIHALCEGTLVLETQQSSDTTYRVYDYDRTDGNGNKRELHWKKALDVSTVPHSDGELYLKTTMVPGAIITCFVKEKYFTVYKWEIQGEALFIQSQPFQLISAIDGEGTVIVGGVTYPVRKGDHLLLPAGIGEFQFEGKLILIVSHP